MYINYSCKMNEVRSIKTPSSKLSTISSSEQTNFRLNEINNIKDYFESEIKERETIIKQLNTYITGFDYTEKSLIVLSATFSGVSIFSHLKIKKHTGFLVFSLTTAVIKKLLYETKKERKSTINLLSWVEIN